ncbi:glycosyltransferase [Leifsonia xyli subsp. cynodontis DSM 46306]|uniref:Glycosyltransferase 2-like domain-containing protein n=1 Tax=Leifsonia xyli subsp. cynodontis DSM 46306 TaxID=1389489 RepID=U3P5M3_LEIXC|nr:glycosyltransferase family 2 protein [Leifsonia xyli]AGW41610.1 glycosyltransferase [Leifsonia xyli subsp. cynodontis DSM 46306]
MTFLARRPDVTIAIPMYRAGHYLEQCLRSIAVQTSGTLGIEVLCVDDGSPDDTVEIATCLMAEFGLRGEVWSHPHTGTPAAARNEGLDAASGHYLYFVDVDDYLGPDAIRSMLSLGRRGRADIVAGKYVGVGRGAPQHMFRKTLARTDLTRTSVLDSMSVLKMYRTGYARSLGYRFNPDLVMAEDHPFAMAAYVRTDRIAIQASTDCYYWVRHTSPYGAAQHLTGHVHPVDSFYAYFSEVFDVLRDTPPASRSRARYAHRKYWNRLFSFDIPTEMRRKRDAAGRRASIAKARSIMQEHGGEETEGLSAKALTMQAALQRGDVAAVELAARAD